MKCYLFTFICFLMPLCGFGMEPELSLQPVFPSDIALPLQSCATHSAMCCALCGNSQSPFDYAGVMEHSYTMSSDWLAMPLQAANIKGPQKGSTVVPCMHMREKSSTELMLYDNERINSYFMTVKSKTRHNWFMYDGANKNNIVVIGTQRDDSRRSRYYFYVQKLSLYNHISHQYYKKAFCHGNGHLASLMLEEDKNRFVYSALDRKGYKIAIKDLGAIDSSYRSGRCDQIAKKYIPMLFIKIVRLGNDAYVALTVEGALYFLWLDEQQGIHYAKQKFIVQPHVFKSIATDCSSSDAHGNIKRIAFLTDKGEVYVTHMDAFKKPTLLYVATAVRINNIQRLYYKDRKIGIVSSHHVQMFDDNFEILYASVLLRKCDVT